MRIGEVIGTVTLNQQNPALVGSCFRLVVPLSLANLTGEADERAEAIVAYDDLGAGAGTRIAISEGREAAQPFGAKLVPIDAYCAAILDQIDIEPA